jgi:hypothetical protein
VFSCRRQRIQVDSCLIRRPPFAWARAFLFASGTSLFRVLCTRWFRPRGVSSPDSSAPPPGVDQPPAGGRSQSHNILFQLSHVLTLHSFLPCTHATLHIAKVSLPPASGSSAIAAFALISKSFEHCEVVLLQFLLNQHLRFPEHNVIL